MESEVESEMESEIQQNTELVFTAISREWTRAIFNRPSVFRAPVSEAGVLRAPVSEAVKEVIGLAKSAIHCKEECSELEDSLTEASGLLDEMNNYSAAEGSLSSSQLDFFLKALKAKVEEARPLVLECQSLQNPILDGIKRITLATKIEHCSKAIHGHLAAACNPWALVSAAVNEVIGLAKSAILCKKKCSELEDSLTETTGLLGEMNQYSAAEGSSGSSRQDKWLNALQAKVEEAKRLVLECQSLQNPILDGLKRTRLAPKIDHCSKAIQGHLAAAPLYLGVEIVNMVTLMKQKEVPSNVVPQEEQHVVPLDEHIFGMEETLERVVSDLLGSSVSSKWVGVHGAGGAGKTLLAKRVCDNNQVKGRFDLVLWVTFGRSLQVEAKQHELAKQIGLEGDQISNETLRRGLVGKRCLLVLDDVWKFIHLDLFDVVQENGSKIFITTRKRDVLDSRGAIKTEMGLLGKEDSMKLFAVHAFPNQKHAQVSNVVVEQVVEKCRGLPLVLKVIGRRMAATQEWDYVLSKLKDQQLVALDEEQQVLLQLKLGYDALLPLGIQQHFLFFAAFPEDWRIQFWDLFKCWKGEGLVANIAEATNVLERLKNHALITEEEGWRGDYKTYRIHNVLLDLALHILEQEGSKCYFKAGQSQMRDVGDTFMSDSSRISLIGCRISDIPLLDKNRVKVSSTTCLLLDYNPSLTAFPSLSCFKRLKVLCLSNTGLVRLPHSIGQLKTLETLDLSWNDSLQSIPASLGNLTNLSYMNLGSCSKLKSFPVDALFKLTKLIYLNGKECRGMWTRVRLFKHLDWMFQALTELEVLIIDTELAVDLPASIGKLAHLKQLEIRSLSRKGTCESFQGLPPNVEILRLDGLKLPFSGWDWSRFLRLRTLEVTCFGQSDFKVTSSMENLQELKLWGLELPLSDWNWSRFPKLRTLDVSHFGQSDFKVTFSMENLQNLVIRLGRPFLTQEMVPMPRSLSLVNCPNLEEVHLDFKDEVTTINISECPSLKAVSISSFGIVAFGGKFPRLEDIEFGPLPDVSVGAMDAFPQLTRLRISWCGIDQLPEWFASLTTLRTLKLWHLQNLDVIPDGVAKLPLLRELDLEGCKKINMLPFADSEDSSFYPSLEYLGLTDTSVSQEHLSERLRKIAKF